MFDGYELIKSLSLSESLEMDSENENRRKLFLGIQGLDFGVVVGITIILFILMRIVQNISKAITAKMLKRIKKALDLRKLFKDRFRSKNGYSWDLVIMFKVNLATDKLSDKQIEYNMKYVLNSLATGEVQHKLFFDVTRKLVYCKLRVDSDRLKREADRIDFALRLDSFRALAALNEGRTGEGGVRLWKPVHLPLAPLQTNYEPCDHVFAPFRFNHNFQNLYQKYEIPGSPIEQYFRGVDRLKLIHSILISPKSQGGCELDIGALVESKAIEGIFPLHDYVELKTLEEKFLRFCEMPWSTPFEEVKNYFGEKIGFYFLYLGHYTEWLFYASFFAFINWIVVTALDGNPNAPTMPYFAFGMGIWTQLFLEFWKRKRIRKGLEWGMSNVRTDTAARPQFQGTPAPEPVKGKEYLYFPRYKALFRSTIGTTIMTAVIAFVIGVVAFIFYIEILLKNSSDSTAELFSSIWQLATVVQIQVLNIITAKIALYLNIYENHRTDIEYEDALIAKTFIFQFVNSFAALVYVAFIKPFIPQYDSCAVDCLTELADKLFVILAADLLSANIMEVGLPAFEMWYKSREDRNSEDYDVSEVSEIQRETYKPVYDVMMGPFEDYAELMIQFGYTSLFVASFPLAVVMSFFSNYVEIRVDAWKLCQLSRRPEPRDASDIGTWRHILEVISIAAVLTNAALITYTSTIMQDQTWSLRHWTFFMLVFVTLLLKQVVEVAVDDVPSDVAIQIDRGEFILSKLLYDAADDVTSKADDNDLEKKYLKDNYVVRVIDDDPL